jgi:hypothetical protein
MEGRWVGTYKGDPVEEQWSAARAGSIMGMFRWLRDGKPRFYELIVIHEEDGHPVMRFKHFNPDMSGWEEKDECLILDLESASSDGAVWANRASDQKLVYALEGDRMTVWFETPGKPEDSDARFMYMRSSWK